MVALQLVKVKVRVEAGFDVITKQRGHCMVPPTPHAAVDISIAVLSVDGIRVHALLEVCVLYINGLTFKIWLTATLNTVKAMSCIPIKMDKEMTRELLGNTRTYQTQ